MSSEFPTFLAAFLGTAALLALGAYSGLLPKAWTAAGDAAGGDGAAAGPWAVLAAAERARANTSGWAQAALLGFFFYVVAVNPLDEARYYLLGFCNPLLYGLPLVLHLALKPSTAAKATAAKATEI